MKRLVLLIGAQGSGKTHYYHENLQGYVRVSQDEQGREGHKAFLSAALSKGEPLVAIDRTNGSRMQRGNYLALARKFGYSTKIVWINTPRHACVQRCKARTGHPTLKPEDAEEAISFYFRGFQAPSKKEADEIEVVGSPPEWVPIKDLTEETEGRRTIIVGDIHGCYDELKQLLEEWEFNRDEDVLISVGDLVDRGPKIKETLEFVMSLPRFHAVMGNHDDKCVRHFSGNPVKIANGLQCTIDAFGGKMPPETLEFLRNLPLIIKTPWGHVVHAGLDPLMPISEQRREDCLYMRYCGGKSYFDSENGTLWYKLWEGERVFFGHIPEASCPVLPNAISLDGGCVFGDYLKAWDSRDGIVHYVKAAKAYSVSEFQQASGASCDEVKKRDQYVVAGLLRKDVSDDGSLAVYNYSEQCTFDNAWDDITKNSRGHVFNIQTGECVAWTFTKFYNLNENKSSLFENFDWKQPYEVYEKLDGWLGTLVRNNGRFEVASRGSFHSDGAVWATSFIQKYDLSFLPDEVTLCFEMITPRQKIIIDYGDQETLYVLAAFNRKDRTEYPRKQVEEWAAKAGLPIVKKYEGMSIQDCLRIQKEEKDREGFVIRFQDGRRIKVKLDWYLGLAKILANTSPISMWEAMSKGKVRKEYLSMLPEEIMPMVNSYKETLESQYAMVLENVLACSKKFISERGRDRKKMGLDRGLLKGTWAQDAVFAVMDNKESVIEKVVMKAIYPRANEFVAIERLLSPSPGA